MKIELKENLNNSHFVRFWGSVFVVLFMTIIIMSIFDLYGLEVDMFSAILITSIFSVILFIVILCNIELKGWCLRCGKNFYINDLIDLMKPEAKEDMETSEIGSWICKPCLKEVKKNF